MSEEEKAIETLKEVASDDFDTLGDDISPKMAQNILNVIDKQQKEIEEKNTILFAGAEKVKQLEKEIEELNTELEIRIKWQQYFEKEYINKDKIRKIINKYIDIQEHLEYTNQELYGEGLKNMIKELLEE